MKVVFLSADPQSASARVRIDEHLPALKAAGIDAGVVKIPKRLPTRLRHWRKLQSADAVVLHRKLLDWVSLRALRRTCRRLILDIDDAIYTRPHGRPDRRCERRFQRLVARVDLVLAGSEHLARAARARGARRVAVLRSGVEIPSAPANPGTQPARLVWTGSSATLPYLEALGPTLRSAHHDHGGWELDVVADRVPDLPGVPVEFHPWSLEAEARVLGRAQIGLYPLPVSAWTQGKCAYKVLRYMAHGLAILSVPHGGASEVLGDRPTARMLPLDQWGEGLEALLGDPELRCELGTNAHERASHVHTLDARSAELVELLRRV